MRRRIVLVALAGALAVTGCLTDGGGDGEPFWTGWCKDPVPFDPPPPGAAYAGYIVTVQAGLDIATEAARIEAQCAIPPDRVYSFGFTIPKVDDQRIACLRCDPAVESIAPNAILLPL